jgi:hypothetical protein
MSPSVYDFRVTAPASETFEWLHGRAQKSGEVSAADPAAGRCTALWRGSIIPESERSAVLEIAVEQVRDGVSLVTVRVEAERPSELIQDFAGPLGSRMTDLKPAGTLVRGATSRKEAKAEKTEAKRLAAIQKSRVEGIAFGPVRLWPDRIGYGKTAYRLSASTKAEVHATGGIAGVNKHDWALMPGSRKGTVVDKRRLTVTITDDSWAVHASFHADQELLARGLASSIDLYVRALGAASASGSSPEKDPRPEDAIEKLERLADLRDRGVLTDDEFAEQKARILGG